jgi:hypothetical protein
VGALARRREVGEVKAQMNGDPPVSSAEATEAQRALAEAEARRARPKAQAAHELNGRGGLDPARYGDWEVKGLASDF